MLSAPSHPTDVAVAHTVQFVTEVLPTPGLRLLEVGCGGGAVAARLQALGHHVTALDVSGEAVAAAHARGVEAIEADFLRFEDAPYDVVLFTRSLHHLESLEDALSRAHELLRPKGLLVAEEFAIERMDLETAHWYFELRSLLEATGLLPPATDPTPPTDGPLERWFQEHEGFGTIHPGEEMLIAMGRRFAVQREEAAPILYRHVCDRIEASERGLRVAQHVLDLESQRLARRSMRGLGLRVVARRRG